MKIGDFGMARPLYSSQYYRIEGAFVLPIRWMAPEALLLGTFSTASDVWAMGVTLWEIWTLGAAQPFANLDDDAVLLNAQAAHYHGQLKQFLPQPCRCSPELHDLIRQCCAADSAARPSFADIRTFLARRLGLPSSVAS